jgi:hypothetical protein
VVDSVWQTAVGKARNFPRERWAQQDLERRYFVAGSEYAARAKVCH